ncbi:Immunoglobulin heavy variable 3-43D [Labeo rohita]|nr:Immunoglobulin heavy variable 3-43D [Labeo rohita]
MKNSLCLLLLSFSLQRIKCQSMESIESTVVKKPGETLTLSCRGSGFSFGCCSMHWIRQQAGKPLVWMGRVYSSGSGNDYSDTFKGRTEITRDNSKSMVYLKVSGIDSYELTQPESLTVRPDATLTINCKVSYSVTDYATAWIRQPTGKALEWIGLIDDDESLYYKDSLKSKFSITRDTSSNTITLQGKNMKAEDTAVYYCAKETQ